ncbi:UvrD-helicase domain-containing protein [Nonomuraea sp. K274]|uniref:UvrD-helicase domain-containing protein n=1 Tax=Nonomuraea cypriaca TaxID=1187855 RepID=A0A931F7I5_9ACTN|nr:UvrD-helicase domain-containing protein [Nonomuraea cypriaca]MBF8194423.1 UvrD-helicase domain-containing protein [Nonomuraea cypriaca]
MIDEDAQWEFLLRADSVDVQAAPGSGKTSLVVLKLASLANTWTEATRGICVLSFTNTAKQEILDGLERVPGGRRLLNHPHFIGTIQDFTHTFLALPWLRSNGIVIESIDDTRYEAAMRSLLYQKEYRGLRYALEQRHDAMPLALSASYYFDPQINELRIRRLPFGAAAKSSAELIAIKKALSDRGIYRYSDVFAIAAIYLHRCPWAARALRERFPYILIDEMQDTSAIQDELLTSVFDPDRIALQRVGDLNQRIFSEDTNDPIGTFPHPDRTLELSRSRRFGTAIARTASQLTATRNQQILGSAHAPEGALAVITFDEGSILKVIPYFEKLATEKIGADILQINPPRVLAGRLTPGTSNKLPRSLTCYAPHLAPAPKAVDTGRLITVARRLAMMTTNGTMGEAAHELWDVIRSFSRSAQTSRPASTVEKPPAHLPGFRNLDRTPGSLEHAARSAVMSMLLNPADTEEIWAAQVATLQDAVTGITGIDHKRFTTPATWREWFGFAHAPAPAEAAEQRPLNEVAAIPSTTASAKGETHSATLLLECLDRRGKNHDLSTLLPYLTGTGQTLARASADTKYAACLAFVGVTRPRHLLALAVRHDSAERYLPDLQAMGWEVHCLLDGVETMPKPDEKASAKWPGQLTIL